MDHLTDTRPGTERDPDSGRTDLIRMVKRLTQSMSAHYGTCPGGSPAEVEELDEIATRLVALESAGEAMSGSEEEPRSVAARIEGKLAVLGERLERKEAQR